MLETIHQELETVRCLARTEGSHKNSYVVLGQAALEHLIQPVDSGLHPVSNHRLPYSVSVDDDEPALGSYQRREPGDPLLVQVRQDAHELLDIEVSLTLRSVVELCPLEFEDPVYAVDYHLLALPVKDLVREDEVKYRA